MKNIITGLVLGALILSGCGKDGKKPYVVIDGFAQGSTYHFVLETEDTVGLQLSIDSLFLAVDRSMSLYHDGSLLNRLNANQTDSLDRYIEFCIRESEKISRLSDGSFDITIRPVTAALGFAGVEKTYRPNIDSLLQFVGYEKIRIENGRLIKDHPGVQIDLNTVAQGYTADLLGELMESRGMENYLVEIGGEVFCRGRNPAGKKWVIGIDRPEEGNNIPGSNLQVKLTFTDKGLATSGNYRKYYEDENGNKIAHIVDARTGRTKSSNLLSATVIATTATLADVYGTLLMIMGLDEAKEFLSSRDDMFGYLVYSDDQGNFRTWFSPGMDEYIIE